MHRRWLAHYVLASTKSSSWSIFRTSITKNCFAFLPVWYRALRTGGMSLDYGLIWSFTLFMRPRCSSPMSSISDSYCRTSSLWAFYLSRMVLLLIQSFLRLISSSCLTCSWFSICCSLSIWGCWWTRLTLSCSAGLKVHTEGSLKIFLYDGRGKR